MAIELAELVKETNMFELAQKTNYNLAMTDEEKELSSELDARFKEIGRNGYDRDQEIAQFLRKTINQEIYEAPDELLDMMFERGTVAEGDDYEVSVMPPENTLDAHLAAPGGNVETSYLDISVLQPKWFNRQIETTIGFQDLKTSGWKTVSLIASYAEQAFRNAMYYDAWNLIDNGIASGADNYINETTTMPTTASMDALVTYVSERADDGNSLIVGLYKYILAASKLQNASDGMKDELYRKGLLGFYGGVPMKAVSSARKVQNQLMLPDKRIFASAGIIGRLDTRGSIQTYQEENVNREYIHLLFKRFEYGFSFNNKTLEKAAKIVL